MTSRLDGTVCVITGTGGSTGRASALAFAREGAFVVGCDRSVDAAETTVEQVRGAGGTTRGQREDPAWASHMVGST
jgi:NAD(P)-dependent dehydrogenase (short-subunit alcohol dehydrogenase family)